MSRFKISNSLVRNLASISTMTKRSFKGHAMIWRSVTWPWHLARFDERTPYRLLHTCTRWLRYMLNSHQLSNMIFIMASLWTNYPWTLLPTRIDFNSLRPSDACVGNLTIIGRRQAIIWTNAGILLIGPLGTNFNEIVIGIQTFSVKKMNLKMSSGKCRPLCLGLNVLIPA